MPIAGRVIIVEGFGMDIKPETIAAVRGDVPVANFTIFLGGMMAIDAVIRQMDGGFGYSITKAGDDTKASHCVKIHIEFTDIDIDFEVSVSMDDINQILWLFREIAAEIDTHNGHGYL